MRETADDVRLRAYAARLLRAGFNVSCERPSLGDAFETLGCVGVELRTHHLDHESRRAIERLGAKLDGVLRNHAISESGTLRDTCVYRIVREAWPAARALLDDRLAAHAARECA